MTPPLRDTRYARELATTRLPSGPDGTAFVAIERIFVKQTEQVEIRFSGWEGSRMMPRPLDLPEEELLPLLRAAIAAGVFSDGFLDALRGVLAEGRRTGEPPSDRPLTELGRVQANFHELIRARAGTLLQEQSAPLPTLEAGVATEDQPGWFPVDGMHGGFKYWWDPESAGLRLMSESWSRVADGSGQLHEITPDGARLLGEGFV
jgi:hypothetical protein